MQCPSCQNDIAEDAAVCPHCDAVLDPSLLDASPDDPPAPSRAAAKRPKPVVRAKSSAGKPPPRRPPPRPRAPPEDDNEPPPPRRGPPVVANISPDKVLDPEEFMASVKHFVLDLSASDRLAFFGTIALAFSCFLPWKDTTSEGEVLGIFTYGALTFALALGALTALILRVRRSSDGEMTYWAIQLAGVGIGLLWCFVSLKLMWDKTISRSAIGNVETWTSTPSFGLVLGIVAGIVAAVGTAGGLKTGDRR
jgi:hypothetical protein